MAEEPQGTAAAPFTDSWGLIKDQVQRGRCVVMIGDDHQLGGLALALDEECGYQAEERAFADAAQRYEERFDRQPLLVKLRQWIETHPSQLQTVYASLAASNLTQFIWFNYGSELQEALEAAGVTPQLVARDVDVPRGDSVRPVVFRPLGMGLVDQVDSSHLVTEQDLLRLAHDDAHAEKPILFARLQEVMSTQTTLLLSCDPLDPYFQEIFSIITPSADRREKRLFVFMEPDTSEEVLAAWRTLRVTCIEKPLLEAVNELSALHRVASQEPRTPRFRPPSQPYKFLDYYDEEDAGLFFGRDRAAERVIEKILVDVKPVTVLLGSSGVGKTSLLKARIIPQLRQHGYLPIYVRLSASPIDAIKKQTLAALAQAEFWVEDFRGLSQELDLHAFLQRVAGRVAGKGYHTIVIILDQFEEALRLTGQERVEVTKALQDCVPTGMSDVKLVLSLREDFWPELSEIKAILEGAGDSTRHYRLAKLTQDEAREVITRPAKLGYPRIEEGLVDKLLLDLGTPDGVDPAQLSIVCFRLYEKPVGAVREVALKRYRELGGHSTILSGYLDDTLALFGSAKGKAARSLLQALVDAETGTRIPCSESELLREHEKKGQKDLARDALRRLIDRRLIRTLVLGDAPPMYELAHECLIERIAAWSDESRARLVSGMVRRDLDRWRRDGQLMEAERVAQCDIEWDENQRFRSSLLESPSGEEFAFYCLSAICLERDLERWIERLKHSAPESTRAYDRTLEWLSAFVQRGPTERRASAAKVLAGVWDQPLVENLVNRDVDARVDTLSELTKQAGQNAIPPLTHWLRDSEHGVRQTAASALTRLGWTPPDPPDPAAAAYWFVLGDLAQCAAHGPAAVGALLEWLLDSQPFVQASAAQVLGALHDVIGSAPVQESRIVPALTARLADDSLQVRRSAAFALRVMGREPVDEFIRVRYWFTLDDVELCVKMADRAVEPLIAFLDDQEQIVRETASDALIRIGSPSIAALAELLESGGSQERPSVNAYRTAIATLARMGEPALNPLVSHLKGCCGWKQLEAVEVLRLMAWKPPPGEPQAVYASLQRDIDTLLVSGQRGIDTLVERLGREDLETRAEAAALLEESEWDPTPDAAGLTYWLLREQPDRCTEMGPAALAPLMALLQWSLADKPASDHSERTKYVSPLLGVIRKTGGLRAVRSAVQRLTPSERKSLVGDVVSTSLSAFPQNLSADKLWASLWVGAWQESAALLAMFLGLPIYLTLVIAVFLLSWIFRLLGLIALGWTAFGGTAEVLPYLWKDRKIPFSLKCVSATVRRQMKTAGIGLRRAAAQPLRWRRSAPEKSLRACLKSQDSGLRKIAVRALSRAPSQCNVEILIELLDDEERAVRQAAAKTLGSIGWAPPEDEIGAAYWLAREDTEQCATIGLAAVDPLFRRLSDRSWVSRSIAVQTLQRIGPIAEDALSVQLWHPDRSIRRAAAEALRRMRWIPGRTAIGAAFWCALDERDKCLASGAQALAALLISLEDPDAALRRAAVEALGRLAVASAAWMGAPQEVGGSDPGAGVTAEEPGRTSEKHGALLPTAIREPYVIWPLLAMLRDVDADVRHAAAVALHQFGWTPTIDALRAAYWIAVREFQRRLSVGSGAVGALVARLHDRDYGISRAAASALQDIGWDPGNDEHGAAYWLLLEDIDKCIVAGKAAVSTLVKWLADDDWRMRAWAATILGELRWSPLPDADGARYWLALEQPEPCAEIGRPALQPLVEALRDHLSRIPEPKANSGATPDMPSFQFETATTKVMRILRVLKRIQTTRGLKALLGSLSEKEQARVIQTIDAETTPLDSWRFYRWPGSRSLWLRGFAQLDLFLVGLFLSLILARWGYQSALLEPSALSTARSIVRSLIVATLISLPVLTSAAFLIWLAKMLIRRQAGSVRALWSRDASALFRLTLCRCVKLSRIRAVAWLSARLTDQDARVRRTAAAALKRIGWSPPTGACGTDYWLALGDIEKSASAGADGIDRLNLRLTDANWVVRSLAFRALQYLGVRDKYYTFWTARSEQIPPRRIPRAARQGIAFVVTALLLPCVLIAIRYGLQQLAPITQALFPGLAFRVLILDLTSAQIQIRLGVICALIVLIAALMAWRVPSDE